MAQVRTFRRDTTAHEAGSHDQRARLSGVGVGRDEIEVAVLGEQAQVVAAVAEGDALNVRVVAE
jgi:hypothetical protein